MSILYKDTDNMCLKLKKYLHKVCTEDNSSLGGKCTSEKFEIRHVFVISFKKSLDIIQDLVNKGKATVQHHIL